MSTVAAPRPPTSVRSDEGLPVDHDEDMEDVRDNGLVLDIPLFDHCFEHVYDSESGGHHPVHLGDFLGDDARYKVIHKLGHGAFAHV